MIAVLERRWAILNENKRHEPEIFEKAHRLFTNGDCQVLSISSSGSDLLIHDPEEDSHIEVNLRIEGEIVHYYQGKKAQKVWDSIGIAGLNAAIAELKNREAKTPVAGKHYTREGMMMRVLSERNAKSYNEQYRIEWGHSIYGEHTFFNENGIPTKITLRDFERETGYIDNADLKNNKLGTTKHIMFAFRTLKADTEVYQRLSKTYPFVEIFLDPQNEYRISWHYPHAFKPDLADLMYKFFQGRKFLEENEVKGFLPFIREAEAFPLIKIRPEVEEKVSKVWDQEMLQRLELAEQNQLDFSLLKTPLLDYQKEGIRFATFKGGSILADEMGLGKTVQAIGAALMKKHLFNFKRTLVICPASLKEQWKQEIERFTDEKVEIVDGTAEQRKSSYLNTDAYFVITNYESVLRDLEELNQMEADFVVLDEAQKIKNLHTITAQSIKKLKRKHSLVLTGTPIESRLSDLYSIMQFVDEELLSPLWEFSYKYCVFDEQKQDKIIGYHHLQELKERLKPLLLRREKRQVIKDLPTVRETSIPVQLHPLQEQYHHEFARSIAGILGKKYISPYDMQKLMSLMNQLRMVCNTSFLIDKETHYSSKMAELKEILLDKIDVQNNEVKIILFSEWVVMLQLIGKMLREQGIGYAVLSGKVAVKNRHELIKKFETDASCKILLSTETGGTGLNLQVADTIINFEVPWNPSRKNQRIGRIDRLGQRNKHLNIINLIAKNSFEERLASGLKLKQNLFDSVLNVGTEEDSVDLSSEGRAAFLQQVGDSISEFLRQPSSSEKLSPEVLEYLKSKVPDLSANDEEQIENGLHTEEFSLDLQQLKQVLELGLDFISGAIKLNASPAFSFQDKQVEISPESKELVIRLRWK